MGKAFGGHLFSLLLGLWVELLSHTVIWLLETVKLFSKVVISFFLTSTREGNGNPLQYSCLENPMDGGAWCAAVHGVATERLQFHFSLSCTGEGNGNPLQCSCLENPREGESHGLQSTGSHRVRHNWSDLAAAAAARFESSDCSFFLSILGTVSVLKSHLF